MTSTLRKLVLLFTLGGLVLAACGGAKATPTGEAPPVVADNFAVIAEGRLLPAHSVQISFSAGGKVTELLAAEGDQVAAGEVIARLENSEALQAQVSQAQLELLNAQQALKTLQDTAAIATAQARFAVAQAQDALTKANKDLHNIENPANEALHDAVSDTKLALDNAQANAQLANVSPEVKAYDGNKWLVDWFFGRYQDAKAKADAHPEDEVLQDALKKAESDYLTHLDDQLALQLKFTTDQTNAADAAAKAQEAYDDATANLNAALRGPNADKLAMAQAKVTLAEATLADAETHYDKIKAGPDADQLALAKARVSTAEAALKAVQASLDDIELRAPLAGALADLNLKVGEQAAPGQPVATIADFSGWVVETDNLTEIEVVKISSGQGASVKLDALPDVTLRGKVQSIGSVFEEKRGDVTYTVKIALDDKNPQMRWGMTAEVTFDK